MKTKLLLCSAAFLAVHCTLSLASVPPLINYQGRLTNSSGIPVNGTTNMAVRVYDALVGGSLLYEESIGAVPITNGVYSFQFGVTGGVQVPASEIVATADGTKQNYPNQQISGVPIAGTLSVTDGNFTWSESTGSSHPDSFAVFFNPSNRRLHVYYYDSIPPAGTQVTATYKTQATDSVSSVLDSADRYLSLVIGTSEQSTRTRILSVPFAMRADQSADAQALQNVVQGIEQNVASNSLGLDAAVADLANLRSSWTIFGETLGVDTEDTNSLVSAAQSLKELSDQRRYISFYRYDDTTEQSVVLTELSFQTLVGQSDERSFFLSNQGYQALYVSGIEVPEGFEVSYSSEWGSIPGTIPPGGTVEVTLSFAPTEKKSYDGSLTVDAEVSSGSASLPLFAEALADVALLSFTTGDALQLNSFSGNFFTVLNRGDTDLQITGIAFSEPGIVADLPQPITIAPGDTVDINYNHTGLSGPVVGTVTFLGNAHASSATRNFAGNFAPSIMLLSPEGWQGSQINLNLHSSFLIRNPGKSDLIVSSVASSDPDFVCDWTGTVEPGRTVEVPFRYVGQTNRYANGSFTIQANANFPPWMRTISYYGNVEKFVPGPKIVLRNSSGISQLNLPQDTSFVIKNSGTADLVVSGISSSNTRFSVSPPSALTISPGESTTIAFTYAGSGGWESGSFSVASDATSGTSSISFNGTMPLNGPSIELSSISLSQRTFVIRNVGTQPLVVNGITCSNPRFSSDWTGTIAPGASQTVNFTYTGNGGPESGNFSVNSNSVLGSSTISFSGTMPYTGPVMQLEGPTGGSSINFAAGVPNTFTIRNIGSQPLEVYSISSTHGDIYSFWQGQVAPGGSQEVSINFLGLFGNLSGTFYVASNAGISSIWFSGYPGAGLTTGSIALPQPSFVISNPGRLDLVINSITSNNPRFSAEWTGTIPAGQSRTINFTYSGGGGSENGQFLINSNIGTYGASFSGIMPATGPAIRLRGPNNNYDVGLTSGSFFTIANVGIQNLVIEGITSSNPRFSADWTGTIAPGQVQTININYSGPGGAESGSFNITSNASSGSSSISFWGSMAPNGPSIELSSISLSQRTFVIRNVGTQPLVVNGITCSNPQFSTDWTGTIPAGGSQTVDFAYTGNGGPESGNFSVNSNSVLGSSTISFSGTMPYTGPVMQLEGPTGGSSINFAAGVPNTFTIRNIGSQPLEVVSVSSSNSDFVASWSGTIAAGGSQTVDFSYLGSGGNTSGSFFVVSNGGTSAIYFSGYQGAGLNVWLSGSVSSTLKLLISNPGISDLILSGITSNNPRFSAEWTGTIAPGQSREIPVAYTGGGGQEYVHFSVQSNAGYASADIGGFVPYTGPSIRLRGPSNSQSISFSPNMLLTVTNIGVDALVVDSISSSNPRFSAAWSGTLAPGQTQTISISDDGSGSSSSGVLTVHSNATSGSSTIQIQGSGYY
jgi:hypothetical protein